MPKCLPHIAVATLLALLVTSQLLHVTHDHKAALSHHETQDCELSSFCGQSAASQQFLVITANSVTPQKIGHEFTDYHEDQLVIGAIRAPPSFSPLNATY